MKRLTHIILILLLFISGTTKAQFAKPLPKNQDAWAEAQYSVGIIGGLSTTRWFHLDGTNTVYDQPYTTIALDSTFLSTALDNAMAGITFQKKLGDYNAIGLDVIYANRSTQLNNTYTVADAIHHGSTVFASNNIQYSELLVQIPITQYLASSSKSFRPYLFIAPRFTLPLKGYFAPEQETFSFDIPNGYPLFTQYEGATQHQDSPAPLDTIPFSPRNMSTWNIGAVVGLGLQYRIPLGSYYFITKLDASCHLGLLNTYSKYERGLVVKKDSKDKDVIDPNGNPVLDLPIDINTNKPIDPKLIGKRYIGNATVKLTLLFPLKKISGDACVSWGEYD